MRASRKAEAAVNILDAVIRSRKAVRAFKSEPVPRRLLMEIVDAARAGGLRSGPKPRRRI
jgi:hypothetical protein